MTLGVPGAAWTLATALACVLVGGVLYAFSAFVMRGLATTAPAVGLTAMQSINRAALRPAVLLPLLLTAGACVAVAAVGVREREPWAVVGGALYLLGTVVVTGVANVPRNEALARVEASSPVAAELWSDFVREWLVWNHVRTAAALAAGVALVLAVVT